MDKYKKIRRIGEGSFGVAYLAKIKRSGKCVVIKEVNLAKLSKPEQEVARKEVMVLSQLKHCNIVTYLDSYEVAGILSLIMDYCDGGDLSEKIKAQNGSLFPEEQILNWFVQLCMAVKYIHDRNILHRDIKTQNLFLTRHGLLKLGDFGIAKVLGNTGDLARTCIGTPYYLSPEICRGHLYDSKSDIWSMGCVLYELSALKHAFEAGSMQELISKILGVIYPGISKRYSSDLRGVVESMLQKNPGSRPSCDVLLKKPVLQSRLKYLLSDLGLDRVEPTPPPSSAAVRHSAPTGDESIFVSGIPYSSVQAAKRPLTSDPFLVQAKRNPTGQSNREDISLRNNNHNNHNSYNNHNNHNSYNNHNNYNIHNSPQIACRTRHPPSRGRIDSCRNDPSRRPAVARKRVMAVGPRAPLKRVHGPVDVKPKRFSAQNESIRRVEPFEPPARSHVPRPAACPLSYPYAHAGDLDAPHDRRTSQMPNLCKGLSKDGNNYNIHNNHNNNNNPNSYNVNIQRSPRPLLGLVAGREPIWSDYEPSPARIRDEEKRREDKVYLERFKEIGLENLRERFNKKMEQLENVNDVNPITGTPSPEDGESRRRMRMKMALIKEQVDARLDRIRKQLECRRQEEFIRESIRISRESRAQDLEEASACLRHAVVPPSMECDSTSELLEQKDQNYRQPPVIDMTGRSGEEVESNYDNSADSKKKKKRSAILKMINDRLKADFCTSTSCEKNPSPSSSFVNDLDSENSNKSKWKDAGHCTNLALLGLEESDAESSRPTRKRRHWCPSTETVVLRLNNDSVDAMTTMTASERKGSEGLEGTLRSSGSIELLSDDRSQEHRTTKSGSVRSDDGIDINDVDEKEDDDDDDGGDCESRGDSFSKQSSDDGIKKSFADVREGKEANGAESVLNRTTKEDEDERIEKFIRNLKKFASRNVCSPGGRTRRNSESDAEMGKMPCRGKEFQGLERPLKSFLSCSLTSHLWALNPRPSGRHTPVTRREEAFICNADVDARKSSGFESAQRMSIQEIHEADDILRNKGSDYDDDVPGINKVNDDDMTKKATTSVIKGREPSDVDPERERIKRKKMMILEIISRSIEANQAWSGLEKDDDNDDGGRRKVKDRTGLTELEDDDCYVSPPPQQDIDDDCGTGEKDITTNDDDGGDGDDGGGYGEEGVNFTDNSEEVDDDSHREEKICKHLIPILVNNKGVGNDDDDDDDDEVGDEANRDQAFGEGTDYEAAEEYSDASDNDLIEEVMRESMASLLVTNPEDVIGELKSMRKMKRRKKMRVAPARRTLRKPSALTKMRKKRKMRTPVLVGSWSSTSIEDLQTMKTLLESYQGDGDHRMDHLITPRTSSSSSSSSS